MGLSSELLQKHMMLVVPRLLLRLRLLSKFEDGATLANLIMAKDIIGPLETLNHSLQSARMSVAGMLEAVDVLNHQLLAF